MRTAQYAYRTSPPKALNIRGYRELAECLPETGNKHCQVFMPASCFRKVRFMIGKAKAAKPCGLTASQTQTRSAVVY